MPTLFTIWLLNSLGIKLVLVHGARPQIESRLHLAGLASQFHQTGQLKGLRITDQTSLTLWRKRWGNPFLDRSHAVHWLAQFPHARCPNYGGRWHYVTAKPWGVVDGVDLQHTGRVRKINSAAVKQALDSGALALVSPLGYSPTGEMFNLSFAEVATHVAVSLKADKLIAFTSSDGFVDGEGNLKRQLSLHECEQQLAKLHAGNDESQSLQACFDVCQQGVPRAQMVSFVEDGALLRELFTRDGAGTLVHRDSYENLRQATIDDVGGILELIEPLEQQGVLVRRSRELLENEIEQFSVLEKDGTVIACAALYPFMMTKRKAPALILR